YVARLPRTLSGGALSFSPDGSLLATANEAGRMVLLSVPRGVGVPKDLTPAELAELYRDLGADGYRLQRVMALLQAVPDRTVRFLAGRLRPVEEAQRKRVDALVAALDDANPMKRDRAMRELQTPASTFEPLLDELARDQPPGEVRNRVTIVLKTLRETE